MWGHPCADGVALFDEYGRTALTEPVLQVLRDERDVDTIPPLVQLRRQGGGQIPVELSLAGLRAGDGRRIGCVCVRSEEHTSELQSLMRISYAVFCLKKKKSTTIYTY